MCANSIRSAGFTMVELLVVVMIAGILAVVVMPKFNATHYRSAQFHAQVVSAVRYAQKTATSHRRTVCITFPTNTSLRLRIASASGGACDTDLPIPGSNSSTLVSPDATNVAFSSPTPFNFLSDGTTGNQTISISGENAITVAGATGYVK